MILTDFRETRMDGRQTELRGELGGGFGKISIGFGETELRGEQGGRFEVLGARCQVRPRPVRLPRTSHLVLLAVVFFAQAAVSQPVLLQIRPRIGDTLRMHLSQTVEMTGTTQRGGRESTPSSMTTSIEVFTHTIAQQWTSGGTL